MVLSLADAVAIFNKWKEDSAEVLLVTESPFQQSRRGVLEQSIDWALGLQGRVSEVSIDLNMKGKKAGTVALEVPSGKLAEYWPLHFCVRRTQGSEASCASRSRVDDHFSALSVLSVERSLCILRIARTVRAREPSRLEYDLNQNRALASLCRSMAGPGTINS